MVSVLLPSGLRHPQWRSCWKPLLGHVKFSVLPIPFVVSPSRTEGWRLAEVFSERHVRIPELEGFYPGGHRE